MKTISAFALLLFLCSASVTFAQEKVTYIQSEKFGNQTLPFSPAVIVGNIIYLSGQIGSADGALVAGGIAAETKQTLENIKRVLEQNGSSMDKIVKCTCMLADMAEWDKMNVEYVKFFPGHKPARSAFGASGLAKGARVEIECIAVK